MTGRGRRFLGTIAVNGLEVVVPTQVWVKLVAAALAAAGALATWKGTADKRSKWSEDLAEKRTTWGENLAEKRTTWGNRINGALERTFDIDDSDSEHGWEMLETVVRSTLSPSKGASGDISHVIADYKALGDGRHRRDP
jgi:hypothetical protein